MITQKTYKALRILKDYPKVTATSFALLMWGEDPRKKHLFTAISTTGNGACRGKKAWLCAGSYIGRLKKMKLAHHSIMEDQEYRITDKGLAAIKEFESK